MSGLRLLLYRKPVVVPALPPLWESSVVLSARRLALIVIWFIFALIGLVNIVARVLPDMSAESISPTSLAVGPAFALLPSPIAGSSGAVSTSFSTSAPAAYGLIPARLSIPAIGVNARVAAVGLDQNGAMQTPPSFDTVGWYRGGSRPGDRGTAVIDGHVNNALTAAGVFEHLDQLRLGDTITISDASGRTLRYTVDSEQVYAVDSAPNAEIFSMSGPARLALVTCDGAWDNGKKEFDKRLVVYAQLAENSVAPGTGE